MGSRPQGTRNVLRYVLGLYQEAGLKPVVAPEVEFFLVHKNTDPDYELIPPKGRSGRREVARLSYSIDAVAEFEDFVEDMYDFADQQKLDVDTLIHENGAAQLEINFNQDPYFCGPEKTPLQVPPPALAQLPHRDQAHSAVHFWWIRDVAHHRFCNSRRSPAR